jgi:cbb3-type cytochrome oxidase subunit 3
LKGARKLVFSPVDPIRQKGLSSFQEKKLLFSGVLKYEIDMSLESTSSWTLGLLVLLLLLFIGFIIAVVIWVFLPIGRIEQKINQTAADIQVTVTDTSKHVNQIVSQVETFVPQIKSAICGFLPNLSICTT